MGELAQNKPNSERRKKNTYTLNEIDKMQYFAHKIVSINREYASQIHNGVQFAVIVSNSFIGHTHTHTTWNTIRAVLSNFLNHRWKRNELIVYCVCYWKFQWREQNLCGPDFLKKLHNMIFCAHLAQSHRRLSLHSQCAILNEKNRIPTDLRNGFSSCHILNFEWESWRC